MESIISHDCSAELALEIIDILSEPKKYESITELVSALMNGSVEQPKVPFTQPRITRILELTPELSKRAHADEIDCLQLSHLTIVVEPSMMPVSSLMWKDLNLNNEKDETVIRQKVEQYRLCLVNILKNSIYCRDLVGVDVADLDLDVDVEVEEQHWYSVKLVSDYESDEPLYNSTVITIDYNCEYMSIAIKPEVNSEIQQQLTSFINDTDWTSSSVNEVEDRIHNHLITLIL